MRVLMLSLVVVLLDQVSKLAVRYFLVFGKPYNIISDFVRLTYIENPGMAFGIQVGGQMFFTVFSLIATVIVFIYIWRARDERMALRVSLALILGGAIGNLIDRLLYGSVVDFIDIGLGATRWPIFNLADTAVTIGMVMLILLVLFQKEKPDSKTKRARPVPKNILT